MPKKLYVNCEFFNIAGSVMLLARVIKNGQTHRFFTGARKTKADALDRLFQLINQA